MLTRRGVLIGAGVLAVSGAGVRAEEYPSRPVRLIVPFPPGGVTDLCARKLGEELTRRWGQPVVIDNRPGAAGNIGAEAAARAPADGYTLYMGFLGTNAANVSLYPNLPYDPARDFAPISMVMTAPMVLTVNAQREFRTLSQLVEFARANPGRLNFGSTGNAGPSHLALELLKHSARIDITHVPYRGTAPILTDLVAGRIDGYFDAPITAIPHIRAGTTRALAVTSPQRRNRMLPDVPTSSEAGLPGLDFTTWLGLFAPGGIASQLLARLNRDVRDGVRGEGFSAWCEAQGLDATAMSIEDFRAFLAAETEKYARVIRAQNIRLE